MQWSPLGEVPQQIEEGWKWKIEVRFQVENFVMFWGAMAWEAGGEVDIVIL